MQETLQKHKILLTILTLATVLRLFALDSGEVLSDEALYGFRSIGMLDFTFALEQPTPLQLTDPHIPDWTSWSFHDHPPLVFLFQNWSMGLFGTNEWGLRLPSALFGIASVYLIYLITRRLFSEPAAFVASALAAVQVLMLYTGRVAIQESQVIFLVLLTVCIFLKALEQPKYWLHTGAALGLAILSKYTAAFIAVPLFIYLIFFRQEVFAQKQFYYGAAFTVLLISPIIIYNANLYNQFGHLDFQLSHMFGQHVEYWQSAPGKEIGSLSDRLTGIGTNLWMYGSWVFTLIATFSVGVFVFKNKTTSSAVLMYCIVASNLLLYLFIGSSPRFLSMLIPWLTIIIGVSITHLTETQRLRKTVMSVFVLLCIWETGYAINSLITPTPRGQEVVQYSKIHWDTHQWGFHALDDLIDETYEGAYPKITVPYSLEFLEDIKEASLQKQKDKGYIPTLAVFVYDEDMSDLAALWHLQRHAVYRAIPVISVETFRGFGNDPAAELKKAGVTDIYFFSPTEHALLVEESRRTGLGNTLRAQLEEIGVPEMQVRNAAGQESFTVFHF